MATTIVTKSGSGAPAASDLVAGELAVDLTNKRLYTEDSSAAIIELGTNPSGNVTFGDNGKAIFGAGSDLQIYHDGSNSYIKEDGVGNLIIAADDFRVTNVAVNEVMISADTDGVVNLYHDGSVKLFTTATGIDVTGTVTADGLTLENSTAPVLKLANSSGSISAGGDLGLIEFYSDDDSGGGNAVKATMSTVQPAASPVSGEVVFKTSESTGSLTERLRVKASGIDVTGSITADGLTVNGGTLDTVATFQSSDQFTDLELTDSGGTSYIRQSNGSLILEADRANASASSIALIKVDGAQVARFASGGDVSFYEDTGTTAKLVWDASAEMLTTSGLTVSNSSLQVKLEEADGTYNPRLVTYFDSSGTHLQHTWSSGAANFIFEAGGAEGSGTERMRIDGDTGNVGIGTSSPATTLDVSASTTRAAYLRSSATGSRLHFLDATTASITTVGLGAEGNNMALYSGGAETMRLDSNGNVGIGTDSPATALHVDSGTSNVAATFTSTDAYALIKFEDNDTTTETALGALDNDMVFRVGAAERIRIEGATGNVGIGTSSPSASIDVVSSGTNGQSIAEFSSASGKRAQISTDAQDDAFMYLYDSADAVKVAFRTDGNASYINGGGNVGIGTSSPDAALHIVSSTVAEFKVGNIGPSDNSAIRVSRNDTTVTTGNPLGYLEFGGNDSTSNLDTSFAYVGAEASGTHAAGNNPTELVFGTTAGSTSAPVERMRIDSNGNVGIGSTNPSFATGSGLEIQRTSATATMRLEYTGSNALELSAEVGQNTYNAVSSLPHVFEIGSVEKMRLDASGNLLVGTTTFTSAGGGHLFAPSGTRSSSRTVTTAAYHNLFYNANGIVGGISTNGSATTYATSSDQRLKENIADADDAGSKIDSIQVRKYDWKVDGSHQDYGMIAQELLEVAPEAVSQGETEDDMMGVDYSKLVPMMLKEIQSLRARIAQLES